MFQTWSSSPPAHPQNCPSSIPRFREQPLSTEGPIAEAVLAFESFSPCISRQAASLRRPIPTAGRAALPWFLLLLPGFRPHQSLSAWLGSQFCPPLPPAPQGHQDHFKASHPAPYRKPLGAFPAFANSFIIWVLPLFLLSASHLLFLSHSVSLHLANRLLSETQPGSTPSQSAFTATSLSAHGVMPRLSDRWPLWQSLNTWGCFLGRA